MRVLVTFELSVGDGHGGEHFARSLELVEVRPRRSEALPVRSASVARIVDLDAEIAPGALTAGVHSLTVVGRNCTTPHTSRAARGRDEPPTRQA